MTVQDDRRENELINLFQLEKPAKATRSGTDAILNFAGQKLAFELKSTTKSSVTTVRDFSPDHIKKWQNKHWLFGFYEAGGKKLKYCLYGSPKAMAPWIQEKAAYIKLDYQVADLVPALITKDILYQMLGQKKVYSLEEARQLQKKQYSMEQYRDKMDMEIGYSPETMLSILQDRCRYLLQRGSTLNNPHIPDSYFHGWERIATNHAQRLRELVRQELLNNASAIDTATQ